MQKTNYHIGLNILNYGIIDNRLTKSLASCSEFCSLFLAYNEHLKQFFVYSHFHNSAESIRPNSLCFFETLNDNVLVFQPLDVKFDDSLINVGPFLLKFSISKEPVEVRYRDCKITSKIQLTPFSKEPNSVHNRDSVISSNLPFRYKFHAQIKCYSQKKHPVQIAFNNVEEQLVTDYYTVRFCNDFVLSISDNASRVLDEVYENLRKKISSFDLNEILKDLEIQVDEWFHHKIGGDDTYSMTEIRTISYPIEKLDDYLINYLRIGSYTYRDTGYCPAENMALPSIVTGKYTKRQVEVVRKNLIKNYSLQEHLRWAIEELIKKDFIPKLLTIQNESVNIHNVFFNKVFIQKIDSLINPDCSTTTINFEEKNKVLNDALKNLAWLF